METHNHIINQRSQIEVWVALCLFARKQCSVQGCLRWPVRIQTFLRFRVSVVSNVTFVLSWFVPHSSILMCLEKAVLRDCGIIWVPHLYFYIFQKHLGPVVQTVVSLTNSLRVISLTVLANSIYNIRIFFAEKM